MSEQLSGGGGGGGGLPPAQPSLRPAEQYTAPQNRPPQVSEAVMITGSMLADTRVDFERGMSYFAPLTITLIGTLAIVFFGWQIPPMGVSETATLSIEGALVRERVLAGEAWRLLSAAFLHGGFDHLFGNCVSLYILGLGCEHALGARGMAVVFLVSALGGSLASMALSPGPSVGASGAIFGLMGALVLTLHRQRDRIFVRDKRIGVVIAVWALYTLLLGAMSPFVDNGAHLGGLIAGALAAGVVPVRLLEPAKPVVKRRT